MTSEKDELIATLYRSIDNLKAYIANLESELAKIREDADKPHPASPGWSGNPDND